MSGRGPMRRKTGQSHLITKAEVSTQCPRVWAQREKAGPVPGAGVRESFLEDKPPELGPGQEREESGLRG